MLSSRRPNNLFSGYTHTFERASFVLDRRLVRSRTHIARWTHGIERMKEHKLTWMRKTRTLLDMLGFYRLVVWFGNCTFFSFACLSLTAVALIPLFCWPYYYFLAFYTDSKVHFFAHSFHFNRTAFFCHHHMLCLLGYELACRSITQKYSHLHWNFSVAYALELFGRSYSAVESAILLACSTHVVTYVI